MRGEADKALALVQIMEWISPNLSDSELRCRQFEESLIRMGGDLEDVRRPVEQWQRFAKSWQVISQFIRDTDMSPRLLPDDAIDFLRRFNDHSRSLCSRMVALHHIKYKDMLVAYKAESKDDSLVVISDRVGVIEALDRLNKSSKVCQQMHWEL